MLRCFILVVSCFLGNSVSGQVFDLSHEITYMSYINTNNTEYDPRYLGLKYNMSAVSFDGKWAGGAEFGIGLISPQNYLDLEDGKVHVASATFPLLLIVQYHFLESYQSFIIPFVDVGTGLHFSYVFKGGITYPLLPHSNEDLKVERGGLRINFPLRFKLGFRIFDNFGLNLSYFTGIRLSKKIRLTDNLLDVVAANNVRLRFFEIGLSYTIHDLE